MQMARRGGWGLGVRECNEIGGTHTRGARTASRAFVCELTSTPKQRHLQALMTAVDDVRMHVHACVQMHACVQTSQPALN